MPFYQFTVPSGGATLDHKPEIAAAVTKVHSEVTGAPGTYVHCSFVEVPPGSIFAAGEFRARLMHGIADAWCEITGDAKESVAIFLQEIPGANVMEDGVILPEITDEPGAIY